MITEQTEILNVTKDFYQALYYNSTIKSDEEISNYINESQTKKLSVNESIGLEGELSYSEASITLKNMKNSKSPGSDGYTPEFF